MVIRKGDGPWARFMEAAGEEFGAAVKTYLGWVAGPDGGMCMVGQLVPPVVCLIPASEIEAMHRIIGATGAAPKLEAFPLSP